MLWTRYLTALSATHSLQLTQPQWYPEVLHFCPTTPIILLGLKSDLRNKRTCIDLLKTQGLTPVTTHQGQAVAKKMGALYMECSSKEMTGVHEIFEAAINTVVAEAEGLNPTPPASRGSLTAGNSSSQQPQQKRPQTSSRPSDNPTPMIAPSKKKKRKACLIL
ncbi:ras-domain-containing protein, partial [Aureobasidium melanogenum]